MKFLGGFSIIGLPAAFVGGFFGSVGWGLHEQSWAAFWTGGIVGSIGAAVIMSAVVGLSLSFGGPGTGSIDNPHPYGSTEWYRHENERRKYYEGK